MIGRRPAVHSNLTGRSEAAHQNYLYRLRNRSQHGQIEVLECRRKKRRHPDKRVRKKLGTAQKIKIEKPNE